MIRGHLAIRVICAGQLSGCAVRSLGGSKALYTAGKVKRRRTNQRKISHVKRLQIWNQYGGVRENNFPGM